MNASNLQPTFRPEKTVNMMKLGSDVPSSAAEMNRAHLPESVGNDMMFAEAAYGLCLYASTFLKETFYIILGLLAWILSISFSAVSSGTLWVLMTNFCVAIWRLFQMFWQVFGAVVGPVMKLVGLGFKLVWYLTTMSLGSCGYVLWMILGPTGSLLYNFFEYSNILYSFSLYEKVIYLVEQFFSFFLACFESLPKDSYQRLGICVLTISIVALISHNNREKIQVLRPCYLVPILLTGSFFGFKYDEWDDSDDIVSLLGGVITTWIAGMFLVRQVQGTWQQQEQQQRRMINDVRHQHDSNRLADRRIVLPDALSFSDNDCAICLEGLRAEISGDETNCEVRVLQCRHAYHEQCIAEWHRREATCPQCRSRIVSFRRILISTFT
jgi:hypothetical protein